MTRKIGRAFLRLFAGIRDVLAWLGGANLAILNRAPTTRGKFVQMGLVLLTTASIAAISMTFFIRQEVNEPESTAVLIGVFWGLVILNLDRFLVISMGATRDKRRLLLMAAPRLCLAIVISLVVSTPITLRLFQSDISNELQTAHLNESANLNGLVAKSGPALAAATLASKIQQDQRILDGALPQTVTNPQLQTAQQQVATLQPQVTQAKNQEIAAYAAWQCELYGDGANCANASNRPGPGPIAEAKHQTYEQDLASYNSLYSQLQQATKNESQAEQALKAAQGAALLRYQKAARHELPGLQKQYNADELQITNAQGTDQTLIAQNTGTLAQLSALWSASAGNAMLMLAHLTVMALFFLIELLPVLVKILLNLGSLDAYEKVLKAEEDKVADKVRLERLTVRQDAERQSSERSKTKDADSLARIKVAEDKSGREKDLGIRTNKYVAQKMETILDAALMQWSAQVTATLNNAQPGNTSPQNGAAPSSTTVPMGGTVIQNGTGTGAPQQGIAVSPNGNGAAPTNGFGLPPGGNKI